MDKRRKKRLLILCAAAVILVAAGSVRTKLHPPRPLHDQIADYMYHSRTDPKLEYCIEKYGDEFAATKYGSILSTRFPNFYVRLDWSEEEQTYKDNYIVYLRQEELAAALKPMMETIFGACKLFVSAYRVCPSAFGKDTTAGELLSVAPEDGPVVQVNLFTTQDPAERDAGIQQLINSIQERGYSIFVNVKYVSEENYELVTADNYLSDLVIGRDFYKYSGSISIYPGSFEWHLDGWKKGTDDIFRSRTNPKLEYCIEKYGDEFIAMEYGSILSTRFPNFYVRLDWSEEEQTYKDDYVVYLRQEELAAVLKPMMETIFGACKLFVFAYRVCPSAFGKDTTAEELLSVAPEDGPVVQINLFTTQDPAERDADIQQLINFIQERGYSICVNVRYLSEENYELITAVGPLSDLIIDRDFYKYFGCISIYPDSFEWSFDGWVKGTG